MYVLTFFVPADYAEQVKAALFHAGAGRYEKYDCCAWQVLGKGQFRPLAGSSPHIGSPHTLESVDEYRIEMLYAGEDISAIIHTLKSVHPYEQPAYYVTKIESI